jgi:sugar lactone lactonase YvrE
MTELDVAVRSHDRLGESPRWDSKGLKLWWVDMEGSALRWYSPSSGQSGTEVLRDSASSIALSRRGLIGVFPDGVHLLCHDVPAAAPLVPIEAGDDCYLNDSACDPYGRLWVGSGSDVVEGRGALWRVAPEQARPVAAHCGLWLANGIGWSPDGREMFVADSYQRVVYRFGYEPATGALGEQREFCTFRKEDGLPDGLAVDVEGGVWVALWGGGAVWHFSPNGERDMALELPVTNVTACAFGGDGRTDLYITTARAGLDEAAQRHEDLAGSLFRAEVSVEGLPTALCAL